MHSSFSRRTFLEGAAAAVGAVLIAGCGSEGAQLQAKETSDGYLITGAKLPESGSAISFSFPEDKPGILYKTKYGQTGAVSAICTHQGCTVQWTDGNPEAPFACPCHQSKFDLQGKVLGGPARTPLAHFTAIQKGNDVELKPA